MKVLFNCYTPYMLAHGGEQVQIEQTQTALKSLGVRVEPLRWWDEHQTGEILHHFGRIPFHLLHLAQQKGMKVVFSDLLGGPGARSRSELRLQRLITRFLQRALPPSRVAGLNWESYRRADACIALTPWEAHLMSYIFGAPAENIHTIPNGVEELFLNRPPRPRGQWLVCTATIRQIKRIVELAEAAVQAQTPVWIIGKPYSDSDPHARRFLELVRQQPQWLRYEGAIEDREKLADVYRAARGFVLVSAYESLSLSALEAAACECPLLLSDLPWARTSFGDNASYCPVASPSAMAPHLKRFYDAAPNLKCPPKPLTWLEVAKQLEKIYQSLLGRSK
jgi:glycosyltransferase involved in cell wall biosynthesis